MESFFFSFPGTSDVSRGERNDAGGGLLSKAANSDIPVGFRWSRRGLPQIGELGFSSPAVGPPRREGWAQRGEDGQDVRARFASAWSRFQPCPI